MRLRSPLTYLVLAAQLAACGDAPAESADSGGIDSLGSEAGSGPTTTSTGSTSAAATTTGASETGTGTRTGTTAGSEDSGTQATRTATTDASTTADDASSGSTAGPDCGVLVATLRDLSDTHPDFEDYLGASQGLVLPTLAGDATPQFNPSPSGPAVITSAASFADWYHDVPGTNLAFTYELPLTDEGTGEFVFDSAAFFPLDDLGFGNEGRVHNFHFTTELHTSFTYEGGEVFTFRGDDDVWMFIDGQLALDIGGVHGPSSSTIDMDTLGLTLGQTYPMDVFHAERHTTQSNFRIVTTIDCFVPVPT